MVLSKVFWGWFLFLVVLFSHLFVGLQLELNYDEGNFLAAGKALGLGYRLYEHRDNKPPLGTLIPFFLGVFDGVWFLFACRLFSCLVFALSCVLVYFIVLRFNGSVFGGLFAGFLFSVQLLFFSCSYHVSVLVCFAELLLLYLVLCECWFWSGFMVVFGFLFVKQSFVLVWPVFLLVLFFYRSKVSWGRLILGGVVCVGLFLVLSLVFFDLNHFVGMVFLYNLDDKAYYGSLDDRIRVDLLFDFLAHNPLFLVGLVGFYVCCFKGRMVFLSWVGGFLLFFFLVSHFWNHYFLELVPPLCVLVGLGVGYFRRDDGLFWFVLGVLVCSQFGFLVSEFNELNLVLPSRLYAADGLSSVPGDSVFIVGLEHYYFLSNKSFPESMLASSGYLIDSQAKFTRMACFDDGRRQEFLDEFKGVDVVYFTDVSVFSLVFNEGCNKWFIDYLESNFRVYDDWYYNGVVLLRRS